MSVLPPTTDICALSEHFRFVPTKDISQTSINNLVRAHKERRRNREAKRFGGPHVDDEVEARGALKRQLACLRTVEDALYVACRLLVKLAEAWAIAN
jgi:hypothetical protein